MFELATASYLALGNLLSGGGAIAWMLSGGGIIGAIVIFFVLRMIGGK